MTTACVYLLLLLLPLASCQDQSCTESSVVGMITQCSRAMLELSQSIAHSNPVLNRMIYPVFSFTRSDLNHVCDSYARMLGCLPTDFPPECNDDKLLVILDGLFGHVCASDVRDIFIDVHHQCINSAVSSSNCVDIIVLPGDESTRPSDKCVPVKIFYECVSPVISEECGPNSLQIVSDSLRHFGCAVVPTPAPAREEPTTPATTLATTLGDLVNTTELEANTTEPFSSSTTAVALNETEEIVSENTESTSTLPTTVESTTLEILKEIQIELSDDDLQNVEAEATTTVHVTHTLNPAMPLDLSDKKVMPPQSIHDDEVSSECSDSDVQRTRQCLEPVMDHWADAYLGTPGARNVSYPLLRINRTDLLALCDLYASAFLDCSLDMFHRCRADPIVSIADALFGYTCGNASPFFHAFDCLQVIAGGNFTCASEIELDESLAMDWTEMPHSELCSGLDRFSLCVKPEVDRLCLRGSMDVLHEAFKYFGCSN